MRKTRIEINSRVLEPWREVADVLGLSMPALLERLIQHLGKFRNERSCVLDEQVTQSTYTTREQAAVIAERLEARGAGELLAGRGCVMVAEVVPHGKAWGIETDYLISSGWLGQDPGGRDGEQWKDARYDE